MKVLHINETDISGGAARAVYRLHNAFLENSGVNSIMIVNHALTNDKTIIGPKNVYDKFKVRLKLIISNLIASYHKTDNPISHSIAFFSSKIIHKINSSDADIVNLHWINGEMISIEDIAKIDKPLVWTLHDMWAFCGAEHISLDNRFIDGYCKINKPITEKGLPINNWVWKRKVKSWKKPITIIVPSRHMAELASKSFLMKNWKIFVIPNSLNINIWKPVDKLIARNIIGLPLNIKIIAFGALGVNQYHKGFDLLINALKLLNLEVLLLVFGNDKKTQDSLNFDIPVHYMGNLNDDLSLKLVYSSADVMVVPSRFESFGQTASEALACATPVVAFNTSGLKDIVTHKVNGYLAEPFNVDDLANGITWTLQNNFNNHLGNSGREYVINNFSSKVVAEKYISVYNSLIQ
jgi:glycosyltransferase involved in cell wall biosynthesis